MSRHKKQTPDFRVALSPKGPITIPANRAARRAHRAQAWANRPDFGKPGNKARYLVKRDG